LDRAQRLDRCARKPLPILLFDDELFPTRARQLVELRALVVFRNVPLRLDPPALLESVQSGIQRSFLDLKSVPRNLCDALTDSVTMESAKRKSFEDQHIQRPLKQAGFRFGQWVTS